MLNFRGFMDSPVSLVADFHFHVGAVRGAGGWRGFRLPGFGLAHGLPWGTCRPACPRAAARSPPGTGVSGPWGPGYDTAPTAGLQGTWLAVQGPASGRTLHRIPWPHGAQPGSADGRGHVPL